MPDAIIIPKGKGDLAAISALAKKALGIPVAYSRNQGDHNFITGHCDDTINFPTSHETRAGQPRYTWAVQPDGTSLGTLVDGAKDCRAGYVPRPEAEVKADAAA